MIRPTRTITVYGRQPVLEALAASGVVVEQVLLATSARGEHANDIIERARERGVPVKRVSAEKVTRISGNGRHDQGVVADVIAPGLIELDDWLDGLDAQAPARLFLIDGLTNPGNVGMVLRVATAAGLDGTVLPRFGAADIGPLVVKASAGVAFTAAVLRSSGALDAARALRIRGFDVVALDADAGEDLYAATFSHRCVFVLGNETSGISDGVAAEVTRSVAIPLQGGVESLNVATAAAVVGFELARRDRHV